MKEYRRIGDLVDLIDERNKDEKVQTLIGVSIDKCFIKSVANTIGTDLSNYKLISKNLFACNPMHVGRDERLPVSLYLKEKPALVSPAYFMFRIKNEKEVLPEFLMLLFKRKEFDRNCWFRTDGSVRGGITWNDICDIKLPVPDIKEQQKIVDTYNAITRRIQIKQRINAKLEEMAQCLFEELFMKTTNDTICLNEIVDINPERNLIKGISYKSFEMASLPTKNAIPTSYELKEYNGGMKFRNGDTLMARITPCLENGKAAYMNLLDDNEVAFGSTEYIVLSAKKEIPSSFNYFLVRNEDFITYAVKHMNGSSGRQRVSGDDIGKYKLPKPSSEDLNNFDLLASKTLSIMKESSMEINKLEQLKQLVVLQISKR